MTLTAHARGDARHRIYPPPLTSSSMPHGCSLRDTLAVLPLCLCIHKHKTWPDYNASAWPSYFRNMMKWWRWWWLQQARLKP